ncbi:MAG: GNAT family N-acetyltransferase [Candidatus Thorarchaeota archaeon]
MTELQLETKNWDETILDDVAQFIFDNRIGIYRNARNSEGVRQYLTNVQKRYPADMIFLVRKDEALCGWLSLDRASESVAELGRWQPIIENSEFESEIANLILQTILNYANNNGITRIEGVFNGVTPKNLPDYERSAKWFDFNGIRRLEDNVYLTLQLQDFDFVSKMKKPNKLFRKSSLVDTDEESLYRCFYKTFSSSCDREFLDSSDKQRREMFDKSIHNGLVNNDLSFVWMDGERIIGFAVVHSRDDEEHIDLFGIVDEYRGQGIAKSLLLCTIQHAKELGYSRMSIGVDTTNSDAFHLYENVGFTVESRTIIHAWKGE